MSSSDVKASKALAATGQLQGYIGSGAGTATNLGPRVEHDQQYRTISL